MTSPVVGLAEIVLWTHDMERSLAFYRDLFGLQLISKPEVPARFLSTGEVAFQSWLFAPSRSITRTGAAARGAGRALAPSSL